MRKGYKFDELSDRECLKLNCKNRIKARLLDSDAHGGKGHLVKVCYKHYKANRNLGMNRRDAQNHV